MKCLFVFVILALATVALADKPQEAESIEPKNVEVNSPENAVRDKRTLVLGAAYTSPVAYAAYTSPVAYSAAYSLPYAYSAYRTYPYYSAYSSPYIIG